MNLTSVTSVNGIALTQPEKNLLTKLATKHGLVAAGSPRKVANRFTGVTVTVDGVVAALIGFVYAASESAEMFGRMIYGNSSVAVQDFDRARYLVMKLDSSAYYEVLD